MQFGQTVKVYPNSKPKKSWDEVIRTTLWVQMESFVYTGRTNDVYNFFRRFIKEEKWHRSVGRRKMDLLPKLHAQTWSSSTTSLWDASTKLICWSLNGIDRKSRKWWHRLLWHFIDITTINAFVLFKLSTIPDANKMMLKDFRCRIVTGLVGSYLCKGERGRASRKLKVFPKFKPYVPP